MKNILLLGEENKRYSFFKKAAAALGVDVELLKWNEFSLEKIKGVVKIDPPIYFENNIKEHNCSLKRYIENLKNLSKLKKVRFLNLPKDILELLDKDLSKKKLLEKNIPITPVLNINFKNFDELFFHLKSKKEYKAFIKPKYGSGAMGIIAMKINPKINDVVFYTTLSYKNKELYNTKKINKIIGYENCKNMFDTLFNNLEGDIIIEKWLLKDKHNNENYDLRVLYQEKEVVYIVGRKSEGPITNLHLNNKSFNVNELNLSEDIFKSIEKIGIDIFDVFKELRYVGVDILITPKKELFVIELNGQGDQIYADMYGDNKIYTYQIKELLKNE